MELSYYGSGKTIYDKVEYKCDLFMNKKNGTVLLKINYPKAPGNFLQLPMDIEYLPCELSTGWKFTLIDCSRLKTEERISEGRMVFSFYARFLVNGIADDTKLQFDEVHFTIDNIIQWGELSGYIMGDNYKIIENPTREIIIVKTDEYTIKYCVRSGWIPVSDIELMQEHISLDQQGYISIEFIEKKDIHEFVALFTKIKRLIELCVLNTIDVTQISAFNFLIYDEYGDLKVPREIEIISSMKGSKNTEKDDVHIIKWLRLPELISNNSFSLYIDKYEKMEPIVELYIETVYNRTMSPVRRFFNIVQALETYHSRFVTNDMEIFRDRIDNIILSQVPEENKEPYRKLLLAESKKFITLRSRIADLMVANFEIIFDTGEINRMDFPKVIALTRNYYTHYDEQIKKTDKVLDNNELPIYTDILLHILEYYILKELGFTDVDIIRKKINYRWGNASQTLSIKRMSDNMKNSGN